MVAQPLLPHILPVRGMEYNYACAYGLWVVYRLRTLDAEHDGGQVVHHVLRDGGHTAWPGHVPEHWRAAEQVLVRGDQTGETRARLQAHRSHRDQSHIRRVLLVQPDDRRRRDRVLILRGLDVL